MNTRDVGYKIGRSRRPRGVDLYCPYDRTSGVIGPQGSGKTLDLLFPALLDAPGGALVTLTKPSDLFLVVDDRATGGRPAAVLDPFGLAPGVPQLVWDPVAGCADPMLARRRARAFAAGTVGAATHGDDAAVFYAAQCANVLQCFFHAAALTGRTLDDILAWVANPATASVATDILTRHPYAAPHWAGMLDRALNGDPRTSANTTATVHQAMDIFFQPAIRARCVPTPGNPATDLRALITEKGTLYLLGRDDPYLSAAPMMTAVAEDILDTVLAVAYAAPHGRLTPPWLSVLDELPSTAPLPTLATRMANDRALGSGLPVGRADLAAADHPVRRERRGRTARADQHPHRVRRRQQPRLQRPDRGHDRRTATHPPQLHRRRRPRQLVHHHPRRATPSAPNRSAPSPNAERSSSPTGPGRSWPTCTAASTGHAAASSWTTNDAGTRTTQPNRSRVHRRTPTRSPAPPWPQPAACTCTAAPPPSTGTIPGDDERGDVLPAGAAARTSGDHDAAEDRPTDRRRGRGRDGAATGTAV